jgi:hypothetical protein
VQRFGCGATAGTVEREPAAAAGGAVAAAAAGTRPRAGCAALHCRRSARPAALWVAVQRRACGAGPSGASPSSKTSHCTDKMNACLCCCVSCSPWACPHVCAGSVMLTCRPRLHECLSVSWIVHQHLLASAFVGLFDRASIVCASSARFWRHAVAVEGGGQRWPPTGRRHASSLHAWTCWNWSHSARRCCSAGRLRRCRCAAKRAPTHHRNQQGTAGPVWLAASGAWSSHVACMHGTWLPVMPASSLSSCLCACCAERLGLGGGAGGASAWVRLHARPVQFEAGAVVRARRRWRCCAR